MQYILVKGDIIEVNEFMSFHFIFVANFIRDKNLLYGNLLYHWLPYLIDIVTIMWLCVMQSLYFASFLLCKIK